MRQYLTITLVLIAIFSMGFSSVVSQIQAQKSTIKHTEDFDYNTQNVFNQLFLECPGGIVLYKMNGEILIVCLMNNGLYKIVNDIDIHIEEDDDDGDNGKDNNRPDKSCLFNVYQPKCLPDKDGNCPDGFNMNEDGRCFPDHHDEGCPSGYHGTDDDETGQCYPDNEGCPDGMELKDGNCTYVNEEETPNNDEEEQEPPMVTPPLEEVEQSDNSDSVPEEDTTTEEEDTNSLSTETEEQEEEGEENSEN